MSIFTILSAVKRKAPCLLVLLAPLLFLAVELDMENSAFQAAYLEKKLPKDGFKAIFEPLFLPLEKAVEEKKLYYLDEDDWLVLVTMDKIKRLYPIDLLIWHEVANDTYNSKTVGISHCILTGSTVIFDSRVEDRNKSFGVSGMLYNSNLVMYDRQTGSLWPQLDLQGYSGVEKGRRMQLLPFGLVRFGYAKKTLSGVEVLIGGKGYDQFLQMYKGRPNEALVGYEDYAELRAAVPPGALKDKSFPVKSLFFYFPSRNEAYPFASVAQQKKLFRTETAGGKIQLIEPAGPEPLFTLYWFALKAFYPGAKVIKAAATK